MPESVAAIEYLASPSKYAPKPVCAVYGEETFLRRQALAKLRDTALGGDEGDFSFTTFSAETELRDLLDELATVAMFGGGKRVVLVEEADEFVTRYRPELEDYVAKPRPTGMLILELKSFPSNTRLFKAVVASGLAIDCAAPKGAALKNWVTAWGKQVHRLALDSQAAEHLVDLTGPELGLLDQELAKLAVAAGPDDKVNVQLVDQFVGTWRTKTTWDMLDAALAGDAKSTLIQVDRLLLAGESPVAILAQIAYTLRQLAAATQLILQAETSGRRITLGEALKQAGTKPFVIAKAEQQLRRLGRQRGDRISHWLLEADLDLKGDSALPPAPSSNASSSASRPRRGRRQRDDDARKEKQAFSDDLRDINPPVRPPLDEQLATLLGKWAEDSGQLLDDGRPIEHHIADLLEWVLCEAFGDSPDPLQRNWWSDGVPSLEVTRIDETTFRLAGVTWWAGERRSPNSQWLGPFEIEVHYRQPNTRDFEKMIVRFGVVGPDGEIRCEVPNRMNQLAIFADGVILNRPRRDKDWAMAIELTPPRTD